MPDVVTASDQALIDDFLAKKKVTKVPTGVTSQAPYVWTGTKLESTTGGWREANRRKSRKRGTTPEVAQRRIKVSDLIHDGKTAQEAADALGVGIHIIYADCKVLGLGIERKPARKKPAPPKPKALPKPRASGAATSRHDPRVAETRARVKDAFDGKKTAAQISRETGVHIRTVKSHLAALGLEAPSPYKRQSKGAHDRRAQLPDLIAQGMTNPQLAKRFGVSTSAISNDCQALGLKANRAKRRDAGRTSERKAKIPALIEQGMTGPEIAAQLGCSRASVAKDCKELGIAIPRRGRGAGSIDHVAEEKRQKAENKRAVVRDRRRFKTGPVPTGTAARLAPPDLHETMFPHSRRHPADGDQRVLKDGANSSKIGGDVLKGRLKGAKIFTLTLEERATCPRSCLVYRECYGNGMQYAHRFIHGPDLMAKLMEELSEACRVNDKVLIRLHVLGDFWSVEYVEFWRAMLRSLPNLFTFGFTARLPGTAIGDAVELTREAYPDRFMIRASGRSGEWGAFTIDFPTEKKRIGDAIVCPEQASSMNGTDDGRHCGSCGLCWASTAPICFVEH